MEATTDSALSPRDQELVAIGASIASGCLPCTTFHFGAARAAGADQAEIRQAVDDALEVRQRATEIMARRAGKLLGERRGPDGATPLRGEDKSRLGELISVSAAFAAACTTSLEAHLAAARRQGATEGQILTALKIACAVKNMAGKKATAAAAQAFGATEECIDDCECQDDSGTFKSARAGAADDLTGDRAGRCSCHEEVGQAPTK